MKINKRFFFIILLFINYLIYGNEPLKIGISRLYSSFKTKDNSIFFSELEDKIIADISVNNLSEFSALNINENFDRIKEIIKTWKENNNYSNDIVNELKQEDYFIGLEISNYNIKKESDFYDNTKFWTSVSLDLKILVIDCYKKVILDEDIINTEISLDKNEELVIDEAVRVLLKKLHGYVSDLRIFKLKVYPTEIKTLFIRLNKGKNDGLKSQDILVSLDEDEYNIEEHTAVKLLNVEDDESSAMILYTKGNIETDRFFQKISKINLEIQLAGGFSLSNRENPVISANQYLSILSFASIRTLIPVGLLFFRPVVQLEFNFFYLDNKLLLPFTVETGFQFEFIIQRFGIDLGLMIGALFSPNSNTNYRIDSVIIRPYLHLSGMINTTFKLFGEIGYRFYVNNNFFTDWQIDLNGVYFSFGTGFGL